MGNGEYLLPIERTGDGGDLFFVFQKIDRNLEVSVLSLLKFIELEYVYRGVNESGNWL